MKRIVPLSVVVAVAFAFGAVLVHAETLEHRSARAAEQRFSAALGDVDFSGSASSTTRAVVTPVLGAHYEAISVSDRGGVRSVSGVERSDGRFFCVMRVPSSTERHAVCSRVRLFF